MIDLTSFQNSFSQQAEKLANLSSEALQWNNQYIDKVVTRQSQFFSDLNDANTAYFKSLSEGNSWSDYKAVNEDYAEDVKSKVTSFGEESTAAYQELQEKLTSVYTALVAQPAEKPAASTAKRTAKKAA
ncbi:MAG: hypothetical protein ACR2PS_00745 [Pseudomonadales bacterium]